jgi:excisionase family DNA binding protein
MARKRKDPEPKYRRKPVSADANALAMSIREFARLHGISEDFYYQLARKGRGPAVMRIGGRTLITTEAAKAWREKMERQTAEATATAA